MGTELIRHHATEENIEIPSIPPGFESLTAFSLKRVENTLVADSCSVSATASELQTAKLEPGLEYNSKDEQIKRSLRRKPCINYSRFDSSSGDESDCEKSLPSVARLPKGVVRGCEKCSNCQKVIARWHPEEGRKPELQDAPVFYPSEEEFEDSLKYIASIHDKAEAFGICRIVPPSSWRPPCPLKQKKIWESSKFATRVQRVDKLQNRDSVRKMVRSNNHKKRKRRRCMKGGTGLGTPGVDELGPGDSGLYDVGFGFEPGPQFTLEAFQKYADDFKTEYFRKDGNVGDAGGNLTNNQDHWEPTLENIEGEYWRMVENPTEEIEVLYGADLETGSFGSGFPKMSHQVSCASEEKYIKSGWNLNNSPRLPGSVLSYESSDISGVLVPWLYVGMCFSSFCWHVEDHHLYSINYMHWGAPKMWYGVAGKDAAKLEAAMRKHLPDLFAEQPDLLHKLVTQLSPSILKAEGVPVFRCIQNPGDFVLTFPRAYHAGFNCGLNCAEAVNVAPVDWLPHGQNAIELYREQGRKTSISHDKLLLGAARDAVNAHWEINLLRKNTPNNLRWKDVCGRDGILSKALKVRVEMERVRREFLCNSSQALKMETTFDATSERECSVCLFDLHLSAAGCHYCSPDKYACLNHAKQFCSCSWGAKFFLFRYDINDLNILVEALEGKLSAIYRWAKLDLGLALTSYVSKDNLQSPGFDGKVSCSPGGAAMRDVKSLPSISFSKEHKGKEKAQEFLKLTVVGNKTCLPRKDKPLSLHGAEAKILCKKEESSHSAPNDMGKPEVKKPMSVATDNVILLSDDEDELPSPTPCSERLRYSMLKHTKDSGVMDDSNDKVKAGMCIDKPVLTTSTQSAAVGQEVTATSTHVEGTINDTLMMGCERAGDQGTPSSITDPHDLPSGKETGDCSVETTDAALPHPLQSHGGKPVNEENNRMILTDSVQIASGSPCTQNNLDRYFRQKGPRIAKVVRRINCNVEPLEYGIVQTGKLWCDSRAIYPKGFRSRVRYNSVLDPTVMCYYISEIVDAQQDRPLFMVSLENCPNEVFIHLSTARCWEMVRDRVNQEITKQHKLGRLKLPPLQPPGSLDGMEMFGFSSPAILQAIQAMDRQCLCTEYWESRPFRSLSEDNSGALSLQTPVPNNPDANKDNKLSTGVDTILCGLFKKANPEELNILSSFLNKKKPNADQGLLTRLLNEEILNRSR